MSRHMCARSLRAASQVLFLTATDVAESVQDMTIEMAGGREHFRVRGAMCYEGLGLHKHALVRGRNAPLRIKYLGQGRRTSANRKRTSPRDSLYGSCPPTHMARFRPNHDGLRSLHTVGSFRRDRTHGSIACHWDKMRRSCAFTE